VKVSPGVLFSLLLAPTFFFLPEFFFVVSRRRLAVSLSVDIICVCLSFASATSALLLRLLDVSTTSESNLLETVVAQE
jgi:hypothetical protein